MKRTKKKETPKELWDTSLREEQEARARMTEHIVSAGPVTSGNLQVVSTTSSCLGCGGDKVQTRTDNGLTVLCPVCNGSGVHPQPALSPYWQPNTTQPNTWPGTWPYESPYRTGDNPWRGIPNQVID